MHGLTVYVPDSVIVTVRVHEAETPRARDSLRHRRERGEGRSAKPKSRDCDGTREQVTSTGARPQTSERGC